MKLVSGSSVFLLMNNCCYMYEDKSPDLTSKKYVKVTEK